MQIKLLLILSLILIIYSKPDSQWKMSVKNEKGDDSPIIIKKGIFTKINFIISHKDGKDLIDRSFDFNDFIIKLEDKNIKTIEDEYHIIPSSNLEYTTYIGLKCDSEIKEDEYKLTFNVSDIKQLMDSKDKKEGNLEIETFIVKIDLTPTYIELESIENEIAQKSFSLFKIKNEIYNINRIKIIKNEDNKLFEFNNIEIKSFYDRNELSENETENHGILFDYPYGTNNDYIDFGNNTNFTYTLKIEDDECSNYFILKNNKLNLIVKDEKQSKLTDAEKEAIISSIENITPQKDETSNIQLKILIPVDSVIIDCKLNNDNNEIVNYKNYINKSGKFIIKFDDLIDITEYKAQCKFTTLNKDSSSIEFTIGNFKDADVIIPLIPSRKLNITPQCVEFIFLNNENLKEFSSLAQKYCQKIMNKSKDILSRIMGANKCDEIKKFNDEELNSLNKSIICAGPTPSFKSKKFREYLINKNNESYFNEQFNQFVYDLNNTDKIKKLFELENITLSNINRYYDDIIPNKENIILEVKTENGMKKRNKLEFKITSNNYQPIECYYNNKLKNNDKKKFINLKNGNSIILTKENNTKYFEVNLSDQKKNDMFSLYLICYNLPGFNIRYESTGIFNAYTYLYTDEIEIQKVNIKQKININCAEKNNKINPHCLKNKYENENIKIKLPEIIENIDEDVEKINELSDEAQLLLISNITNEYKEEIEKIKKKKDNKKEILEKSIKLAKYLSHRDCSRFSNGINNELSETIENSNYKKCRNNKKEIQSKLLEILKENFNCENLKQSINNDISDNVEENIKLIILLINELSNNADSFKKGESQIIYDITMCIQENFDEYFNLVENYKKEKGSLNSTILVIKKDISNLVIKSLVNLIKVLNFDEIDNYISDKNVTKSGIMGRKNSMKLHGGIFKFLKNLNEFGTSKYNLSDSIIIDVIINENYNNENIRLLEQNNNNDEKESNFTDKGIILILHPKYMMNLKNAYSMQIVNYDSPLIPIKTSGDDDDSTLNTFISIILYDNKGNEIKIDEIPENYRPKILYNKSYHKFIKKCFYFNENTEDLDENGMIIEDNYNYRGKKWFKCTSKHLTSFTAGNYYSPGLKWWIITLIIFGILILLVIIILTYIMIKKKNANSENIINAEFGVKNQNLIEV